MTIMQTRRGFLTAMSAAGALGLFSAPRVLAAEGPLETTSVRFFKSSLICSAAPQYAAEELLRAEGFKEIAYVEVPRTEMPQAFADGAVDFTVTFAVNHIQAIDHGAPITILAGVHAGCYELFAREGLGSITELKGKQVGLQTWLARIAEVDGSPGRARPRKRLSVGDRSQGQAARAVRGGQDRCLPRVPARAPGTARPSCRSRDPRHDGGSPVVAVFLLHARRQPGIRRKGTRSRPGG